MERADPTFSTALHTILLHSQRSLPAILFCSMIAAGCTHRTSDAPLENASASANVVIPQADGQDASSQPIESVPMSEKLNLSEDEWKQKLTTEQYRVLRLKGTERPFANEYDEHFEPGTYSCAACGTELFDAETKFHSGCGWPAFYAAKAGNRVELHPDRSHGMLRTEVTCAHCDSHLGHIFNDAPQTPTGQRYCINSVCLKFTSKNGETGTEAKK